VDTGSDIIKEEDYNRQFLEAVVLGSNALSRIADAAEKLAKNVPDLTDNFKQLMSKVTGIVPLTKEGGVMSRGAGAGGAGAEGAGAGAGGAGAGGAGRREGKGNIARFANGAVYPKPSGRPPAGATDWDSAKGYWVDAAGDQIM
jgi:hypothetical protein